MRKNPKSSDAYSRVGPDNFDQIIHEKEARSLAKEAERRALSEDDIRRIDEANADAMNELFKRYGGHRRYKPDRST
ncbi:hypothetical protein D0N87_27985 [Pseudomonas sp. ATCC 13867]|nr:hypothetical protein D0N87_27985 [Pseudomonas sp. ATCC 13867]